MTWRGVDQLAFALTCYAAISFTLGFAAGEGWRQRAPTHPVVVAIPDPNPNNQAVMG
jgi:hypothetical protein